MLFKYESISKYYNNKQNYKKMGNFQSFVENEVENQNAGGQSAPNKRFG